MPNVAPLNSEPLSCNSTLANTELLNDRLRAEVAFTGNKFVAVVVFRVKKTICWKQNLVQVFPNFQWELFRGISQASKKKLRLTKMRQKKQQQDVEQSVASFR